LLTWVLHTALTRDGVDVLGARLKTLSALPLTLSAGLHFASVVLGTRRWHLLLASRGLHLRGGFLLRSYLVGRFAAAFTPSTAGLDLVRAVTVARATGDLPTSTAVIVTEKAVGMLGLALVAAAVAGSGTEVLPRGPALLVAAAALALAASGLALLSRPARVARALPARLLPARFNRGAGALLAALPEGGLRAATLGHALGLGLLGHLSVSGAFAAAGVALGVDASPGDLLAVGNALVVAQLLPVSISGAGLREGVAVLLLGRLGVSPTDAALVSVLGYLTAQGPALVGGLLAMLPTVDVGPHVAPRPLRPAAMTES
jgi:uncharacterized membrane protein YbhN (UPF0104 family)